MNNIKYNNKIILVDKLYLENFTEGTQRIVVDGRNMHTEKEFICELENAFKFPRSCEGNMDRFLDWIRDLSWYNDDKIELIITNQEEFLNSDLKIRNEIIELFLTYILTFWDEEYLTVGGEKREFIVYLTNKTIGG